ncbi:MAG: sulfotransferase domain-containing protein [Anaerolineae bacterium]
MKIFVTSAPKTGNTWLTHLLLTVYDLARIRLPFPFNANSADEAGPSWIVLQHYRPTPDLLAWAEAHGAIFVTPIRHPGDLLVSLWYMLRTKSHVLSANMRGLQSVLNDGQQMGEGTVHYVKHYFHDELQCMRAWLDSGKSHIVRYEDLWRDPIATFGDLTAKIHPISSDRIEAAVDLCDIEMLRSLLNDPQGKFFRKGGPGSWREDLPDDVLSIMRSQDPYPELFRALGYTLDPLDPLINAPAKPRASTNPFVKRREFDNGVEVPAIAIRLYLSSHPSLKAQWGSTATTTTEGSLYRWLNAAVAEDPLKEEQKIKISNLAYYVYLTRRDLQARFPDLFGRDRNSFLQWFLSYAEAEYELDPAFVRPLRDASKLDEWVARQEGHPNVWLHPGLETTHHLVNYLGSGLERTPAQSRVHAAARINPHLPIAWPRWPKGIRAKASAFAQKTIRLMLRWYINPIVEQQNRFNTAVVEALDEMWEQLRSLQEENLPPTDETSSYGE